MHERIEIREHLLADPEKSASFATGPMSPLVAPDVAKRRSGVHYATHNRCAAL
jgi:hypothetical protein